MATQVTGELYESLTGQLFELGRQLRQPSGYPFDPRQLQIALQAAIEGRFSAVAQPVPGDAFVVSIDYNQPLADMIGAGKYDWVNDNITAKRFPIKGTGVVERKLKLWHLDREIIESSEVERLIRAAGQEPSPIEDLLAFGAKFPDKQCEYPIIALGSSAQVNGDRRVPYLGRSGTRRTLRLTWHDDRWHRRCRFLAREVSAA